MTGEEITYTVILGLLVNETTDICPWIAVRLVRWAARLRYPHAPERAATRSEELAALVNDRPGKLFKLFTALGFVLHGLAVAGLRTRLRGVRRVGASLIAFAGDRTGVTRVVLRAWASVVILAGGGVVGLVGVWAKSWAVSGVGLVAVAVAAVGLGAVIRALDMGGVMGMVSLVAVVAIGVMGGTLSRVSGVVEARGAMYVSMYVVLAVLTVALAVLMGVSLAMLAQIRVERLGFGDLNDR